MDKHAVFSLTDRLDRSLAHIATTRGDAHAFAEAIWQHYADEELAAATPRPVLYLHIGILQSLLWQQVGGPR